MINPFLDERPIPKLNVNLKVKVKTTNSVDYQKWNAFFSYLMKKPKSKLTFVTISILRSLNISLVKYDQIKDYLNEDDKRELGNISHIFDELLPIDLKIFILAMCQIPIKILQQS